jgi:tetratricopeptide (TPR) repeat protein
MRRSVEEIPQQPSVDKKRSKVRRKRKRKEPPCKLVPPQVPYISALAMPYSRDFADRVRQNPGKVLKALRYTLLRARMTRKQVNENRALTDIGHVYFLTGRFPQAQQTYEKVLVQAGRANDRHGQAVSLLGLGAVNTAWGKYGAAKHMNKKALSMFRTARTTRETQMILNNLGVLERYRGAYEEALVKFQDSLETDVRPSRERVLILKNTARFYRHWGEQDKAIRHYELSVRAAHDLDDAREQGECLTELAEALSQMTGNKQQALKYAKKALHALQRAGVPVASPMKLMGDLYLDMGALDRAKPFLREAGYGSSLGRYFLLRSDLKQARKHFHQVLRAAQDDENLDEIFAAYTGLGRVSEAVKDYRQAEAYYRKALAITEDIRAGLLPSDRRNFYTVLINGFARSEPAKGLIRVALKQGRPERSIYPGETVRARSFADNLALKAQAGNFGVPKELLEREADIANQLASVITARSIVSKAADKERFSELNREIGRLIKRRRAFVQDLKKTHSDYAEVKYPQPLKLREISLRPHEYAIVLDLVGEGVGVRLLQGRKVLEAFLLPWEPRAFEKDIRTFRRPFETLSLREFDVDLARRLYDMLLADLLKRVPRGSSVTIVTDGLLGLVPFEALIQHGTPQWADNDIGPFPKGVTYVGDLYRVSYGQSLTAISLTRKLAGTKPSPDRMLVLADPVYEMQDPRAKVLDSEHTMARRGEDRSAEAKTILSTRGRGLQHLSRLRATQELARNLKNVYGTDCDVFAGLQCTKRVLLKRLSEKLDRYESIVLATHGFLANDVPGFMEPIMAFTMVPPGTDGLLTMSEVAGMKLNAEVAALTACQTGVGMRLAGEGIMSMGRAFQCAGAKSVIMSLWSVAEEPSVRLMEEFFKAYAKGSTKLEAWAKARNTIREAGFEHPFFWAGFIFVGEPED